MLRAIIFVVAILSVSIVLSGCNRSGGPQPAVASQTQAIQTVQAAAPPASEKTQAPDNGKASGITVDQYCVLIAGKVSKLDSQNNQIEAAISQELDTAQDRAKMAEKVNELRAILKQTRHDACFSTDLPSAMAAVTRDTVRAKDVKDDMDAYMKQVMTAHQ